jgi:hypothetical protein
MLFSLWMCSCRSSAVTASSKAPGDLVDEGLEPGHLLPHVRVVGVDDVVGEDGVLRRRRPCRCRQRLGDVQRRSDLADVETAFARRFVQRPLTVAAVVDLELLQDPGPARVLGHEIAEGAAHIDGALTIAGSQVGPGRLAYLPPGADVLTIENGPEPTRLVLLGGPPFGEQIVMWWNFVGRSHDDVVAYRRAWEDEINGRGPDHPMFGLPLGDPERPLPAPVLPNARIRPR